MVCLKFSCRENSHYVRVHWSKVWLLRNKCLELEASTYCKLQNMCCESPLQQKEENKMFCMKVKWAQKKIVAKNCGG